ncbi:WD40 repeat domain-containing protein, partial [Roseofilum sp. BLCC_M91]
MLHIDIKRILQLNKSLLGGTALLGLGSIAAGILAGPFFGAVANFTAGMVGNNLGALVDRLRNNRDVLRNQDLAKAAARAISLALGKISYQFPEIQGQLQHLASQTEAYWLQWEEQAQTEQAQNLTLFESVREEQLVNIFAQSPEQFSQYQVLRAEEWRELATWLFRQGCQQGALLGELADYKDVIDALAQELNEKFNKNLREVLKDDAANGGEAFAGMLLDLHGATLAKLDTLDKEIKQEFQKLATREDICQALERVESGIHQELQEIKAMLGVVLELLHQRGHEQEGEQLPNLQSFDVLPMQPPLSLLCPYLGLSAFRQEDKHLFFGRDDLIEELVKVVQAQAIVPVIGPSGSGKSSVVFAGLMPELEKKSGWLIESLRPKKDPLYELARALLRLTAPETELQEENINAPIVAQRLRDDPLTLEKWLGSLLEREPQKRILLIIDQFEEVFPTGERALFVQRVLAGVKALNQRSLRVTLLLTMRADFMEEALSESRLAEVLERDVKVKPMNAEQLRAVIEQPAQGLVQIEEGLTARILGDLLTEKESSSVEQRSEAAGCLPLVEFALEKLWQEHERGWLTHEAYDKIGGVKGAIAQHAESVFRKLEPGEQETVRQLLIQLVYPGVENRHTRKIVTRSELGEQQWSMAQELARAEYRLVVTKRNQGTETVELIHEALIREWGRLQGWIAENREFRRWQEQLEVERKLGDWLQGKRLTQGEYWLQSRGGELSGAQERFIRQSIEEREKRRRRVVQGAVAVGGVMTLLAAAAGLFGWQAERRRVEAEVRADALSAQRLVEVRPVPALTRAIAATGRSEQKLGQVLPLVQSSLAETVQVSRERHQFQGHQGRVSSITITPDGSKVISGSEDNTLRVWDIATGESLAVLEGHQGGVYSIAITPDGSKIIAGSGDNTLRVWDIATGESLAILEGHQGSIAITPDGSKVISGSRDNTLRVWDIATGESLAVLEGHQDEVWSLAITPDGSKVISGSDDNTLRVWDIATGESLAVLEGHQDRVSSIAITPDGSKVISGSGDNTLRVWDIATGESLAVLEGHQGGVWSLAITPDGSKVISGSGDNTLRVWDINTGESLAVLKGHQHRVWSLAITPDGSKVISNTASSVRVWDVSTGKSLAVLKGDQDVFLSIAITPD